MAAFSDSGAASLRTLPREARITVRERRRRLCRGVSGRVLDLSASAPVTAFPKATEVVSGLDAVAVRPGTVDLAVSNLWLSAVDDVEVALAQVATALTPDGELAFIEVVSDPGVGRFGQRLVSPVLHRTAGWRVDRDIPALLRAAGWRINDLERIPMPRRLWPIHGLVEGRARPPGGSDHERPVGAGAGETP